MFHVQMDVHLRRHRKFRRLRTLLNLSDAETLLLLYDLWSVAVERARGGDVCPNRAEDLALTLDWQSSPGPLLRALLDCGGDESPGFIEIVGDRVIVHGYSDLYAGKERKRQYDREYHAEKRSTVPVPNQSARNDSRSSRNDGVTQKTKRRNPDQTIPDHTRPDHNDDDSRATPGPGPQAERLSSSSSASSLALLKRQKTTATADLPAETEAKARIAVVMARAECDRQEASDAVAAMIEKVARGEPVNDPVAWCCGYVAQRRKEANAAKRNGRGETDREETRRIAREVREAAAVATGADS